MFEHIWKLCLIIVFASHWILVPSRDQRSTYQLEHEEMEHCISKAENKGNQNMTPVLNLAQESFGDSTTYAVASESDDLFFQPSYCRLKSQVFLSS